MSLKESLSSSALSAWFSLHCASVHVVLLSEFHCSWGFTSLHTSSHGFLQRYNFPCLLACTSCRVRSLVEETLGDAPLWSLYHRLSDRIEPAKIRPARSPRNMEVGVRGMLSELCHFSPMLLSCTSFFLLKDGPRIQLRPPQGFLHDVAWELCPHGEFVPFWFFLCNEVRNPALGLLVHLSPLLLFPTVLWKDRETPTKCYFC